MKKNKRSIKYRDHLLKSLKDPEEAAAYLTVALEDEDPRVFLLALKNVADACGGIGKLAKEASLSRESLYKTLSKKGNPKFQNLITLIHSLGFEFYVQPIQKVS